ncbi:MAG: hypothetical protein JNM32_00925 [Dechloromonas sp.]|nr:hypothetical protein [Dechloromonas sp.]
MSVFRGKRAEGWLGVVRRKGCIDLAHVVRQRDARPRIEALDTFRIEGGFAEALGRLRGPRKLGHFACTTLLDEADYRLLQVEAPAVEPEERIQALRWRLKDMVDFPVEGAAVAALDIPAGEGGHRTPNLFAVVAGAPAVGRCMGEFDAAGLALAAIDIPELAQRNVAALFEEANRGLAFLHLGAERGLLTITYRGELYLARHIEVSADALADADVDRRQALLERLVLELQRTLDNFDRQYNFISVVRMLVACEGACSGLTEALGQNLYIPVQEMDLAAVADFPALPELRQKERQAQCLLALGAALREGEA